MPQLVVTYEYVENLHWSDGEPVTRADYELAYRVTCDPAVRAEFIIGTVPVCDALASVEFLSDTAYRVTWQPGFQDALAFLPPFSRFPAHRVISDGRRLAEAPIAQWAQLDEVTRAPLGVGPYVIKGWTGGQRMEFEANPYYFQGPPATPTIIVRFLEHDQAIRALIEGQVDVLDLETLAADDVEKFQLMQADRSARVIALPSLIWEHLDFALFLR